MASWSPTTEGFRVMFRRPTLPLAEIAWRWSFAAAAWMLGTFGLFEYFDTLPVSNRDFILLRSGVPTLVGRGLAHVLRNSGARFLLAAVVVSMGLAILWIGIASIGRAATLRSVLETIRARVHSTFGSTGDAQPEQPIPAPGVGSLAGLNFLRVLLFAVSGLALLGAAFAANLLSSTRDPHPGLAFVFFVFLASGIALVAAVLNWLLSLAALFIVRDGQDAFGAIGAAVGLCRDRMGAVLAVGTWFGFAHFTFFILATSVVTFPLSLMGILPPEFVLLGMLAITLLYLAIADSLYIGRLAGYAAILEAPLIATPALSIGEPDPPVISFLPGAAVENASAAVDQTELILSDHPASDDAGQAARTDEPRQL